jgi:hypothetical protein
MMYRIKFEHIFAILVVVVLSAALWVFRNDRDMVNIIVTALIGTLGGVTGYFFTKHNPNK